MSLRSGLKKQGVAHFFFNKFRIVWKMDEALFQMFDVASQIIINSWRNSKQMLTKVVRSGTCEVMSCTVVNSKPIFGSTFKGKYHANLMSFQNPQNVCLSTETKHNRLVLL